MITGCLSKEPWQYLMCQRIDDDWVREKASLLARLSICFDGQLSPLASDRLQENSSSSFFCAFDIARVIAVQEGGIYSVAVYNHEEDSMIFEQSIVMQNTLINQSEVRHILSVDVLQDNGTVLLDKDCLEMIVFNCFNGSNEEL